MHDQLTKRRSIVVEILKPHLSADELNLWLELYDADFAASEVFSSDKFCHCLNTLLHETRFSPESFSSRLSDLRELTSSTDNPSVTGEDPLERVTGNDPADFLPCQDNPVSQATPRAHHHRPESRHDPRKSLLLMGTYRHQGQSERIPVVIEDLSRSGVGML